MPVAQGFDGCNLIHWHSFANLSRTGASRPEVRNTMQASSRNHGSLPAPPVASLTAREHGLWQETDALLASVDCDDDTRTAAAWYAVACADPDAWNAIAAQAPGALRRLVEGQQQAERVWALHAARDGAGNSEGLRRLLLAIIRDLRVVYLLLARQLARMRAAAALPEAECRELAQLTRDIHAPLANRLGIGQWKWELEDLAFRYLQPDVYRRIAQLLDERRADREAWITRCVAQLREALAAHGVEASVNGRAKHIYSICGRCSARRSASASCTTSVRCACSPAASRIVTRCSGSCMVCGRSSRASSTITSRVPRATITARCTPR